jgi:hypothetical protein
MRKGEWRMLNSECNVGTGRRDYVRDTAGHVVYSGEELYTVYRESGHEYETMCEKCFRDWADAWINDNGLNELADAVGVEHETI